jgi:hypothetical protein
VPFLFFAATTILGSAGILPAFFVSQFCALGDFVGLSMSPRGLLTSCAAPSDRKNAGKMPALLVGCVRFL